MYYLQMPNRINELKAWVSQTRNKQGWAVTHNALPHLETAEMLEDDESKEINVWRCRGHFEGCKVLSYVHAGVEN